MRAPRAVALALTALWFAGPAAQADDGWAGQTVMLRRPALEKRGGGVQERVDSYPVRAVVADEGQSVRVLVGRREVRFAKEDLVQSHAAFCVSGS
jgi:hypothetical protein